MLLDLDQLIEKYKMDIKGVLHIGAHHGQEYNAYKKHHVKNCAFFEPVYKTFKILEANLYGEDVVLCNVALGAEEGKAKMFIESANSGQSSSLLKPAMHLDFYPHIQFNQETVVDVIRLDDWMKVVEPNTYNFINMDVQGAELNVLRGAAVTLNDIDYIMTEVNAGELYEGCAKIEELDDYLKYYNFKRVETFWTDKLWGDAFYAKI